MQLTTKFEVNDVVRFQNADWRIWEIRITLDDFGKADWAYTLLEPMDSHENRMQVLDEVEIETVTFVRSADDEFARLEKQVCDHKDAEAFCVCDGYSDCVCGAHEVCPICGAKL